MDGAQMWPGTSVDSIGVNGLTFQAVRTSYYADNTRKTDHDNDPGTAAVGDADDKPDALTQTVDIGPVFRSLEVAFPATGGRLNFPVLGGTDAGFNSIVGNLCFTPPDGTTACGAAGSDTAPGQPNTLTYDLTIVVPSNTPSGEYVVTVKGYRDPTGKTPVTETRTLTVGSPPAVKTVSFGLSSPRRAKAGETDATDGYLNDRTTREPATIAAGGSDNQTELTLSVLNANNKPVSASAVSSIVVTTTLGTLTAKAGQTPTCTGGATCAFDLSGLEPSGGALPEKIRVLLTSPSAPGMATVTATVVSGGQVFRPDAVQVRFSGPATSLSIGAAPSHVLGYHVGDDVGDTGMDARDQITFMVDATDASGSAITTPTVRAMAKTSSGALVAQSKYQTSQTGSMMNRLMLDIDAPMTSALAAGTYTLEVTAGTLKASTTLMVVGAADSVELTLEPATATEIGQGVTASVMATDAAGNAVADGTMVAFGVSDLVGDDDAVAVLDDTSALTVAGRASTTLTVVGAGRAVVRATVSDDSTPERDVEVLISTAGAPESAMPAEASLDCLSALSGFATWICDVEATASEVFGWVSGRGASALHLWNGTAWVRYSVVGGTMVPGSSDFRVGRSDILYISN